MKQYSSSNEIQYWYDTSKFWKINFFKLLFALVISWIIFFIILER